MKLVRRLVRDQDGAAAIEMAFALPVLIVMIWMILQLAQVYRAVAGIQQALGEGARYATLVPQPELDRLQHSDAPPMSRRRSTTASTASGLGHSLSRSDQGDFGTASYYDLTVNYTQPTSLLLLPGPTINVTRQKGLGRRIVGPARRGSRPGERSKADD